MGRRNRSGVSYDKESYSYYKRSYAANKSYAERTGRTYSQRLTEAEWRRAHQNRNNSEIIYDSFHEYSRGTTEVLYKKLREEGSRISKSDVSQGKITETDWDLIRNRYHNLRAGGSDSVAAKAAISYMFFGSE